MLSRHRRYFALMTFLLLATPLVVGIVRPDSPELILKEGRMLASAPDAPRSLEALGAFPGQADAYLKDHFGLRQTMIRTHRDLSHPVLYGNKSVLVGRDGRMFYLGRDMVRQSAGLILRDRKVADAADMLAEMRDALARRGVGLLVAVAPNSSTIYQDDLPLWAQKQGRETEYDLFLADLAARGVKAVDLRPVMEKARSDGEAYLLHDTHWTARSAVLAFNAIAEADGHPNWRLDPGSSIGPPAARRGGDVARIMGVEDEVTETVRELALPSGGTSRDLSPGPTGRGTYQVRSAKRSSGQSWASACTSCGSASVTAPVSAGSVSTRIAAGQRRRQLLRAVDPVPEPRHRLERVDADVVDPRVLKLLRRRVRDPGGEEVAGQQQDRDAVDGGERSPGHHVGRAGADRGGAGEGRQPVPHPGKADRRVHHRLLVAGQVVLEVRLVVFVGLEQCRLE